MSASKDASTSAPKTKTKKKDAPIKNTKAEDPHGKKPAGRKPPTPPPPPLPATAKKPSMRQSRRNKNKKVGGPLPLLFQRMPQLMNFVDDPCCVDSLVKHLSSWKPFESLAAVKASDPMMASAAAMKTTNLESERQVDVEAIGDATKKSVKLENKLWLNQLLQMTPQWKFPLLKHQPQWIASLRLNQSRFAGLCPGE